MIKQIDCFSNEELIELQKTINIEILQVLLCERYKVSHHHMFYEEFGKEGKIVKEYFTRVLYKIHNQT